VTTTNLTEDDEAWIVSIEDRVKKVENTLRQRVALQHSIPKLAPPTSVSVPAPATPTAAQDARLMQLIRNKAKKHLRTFSFEGAERKIIDGSYDGEILGIFCAPSVPGK
jgi:hypothetical protein